MVVSYKYIYTEILLCRLSWGSVLQFRTLCFLDPTVYPGLAGAGDHIFCCQSAEWWKRTHTHPLFMLLPHRPSFLHNDLSLSRILEPRILICGDTGLTQHELPLSNDFILFTFPIWGIDLHCDSRPLFPLPVPWGLGSGSKDVQSEPRAIGTKS